MGNKILVVYYSLEGNTKLIAEAISEKLSADILRIRPKKDIDSKSRMKYLVGGKQAVTKEKPELVPYEDRKSTRLNSSGRKTSRN